MIGVEETGRLDRGRAIPSKIIGGKRSVQVRVEIPVRATEKAKTVSLSVVERNKPRVVTSVVQNRLELVDSSEQRSPKGNATSSIVGSSRGVSESTRAGGMVTVKVNEDFSYRETKRYKHDPVASSTNQQKISNASVTPTTIKVVTPASLKERQSPPEATHRGRQTPVDQPGIGPVYVPKFSPPKLLNPIVISDEEGDDEDGKDFVSSTKIPRSTRSASHDAGVRPEKPVPILTDPKPSKKDHHEYTDDADSDEDADYLLRRFAPATRNTDPPALQSFPQHDSPHRHQSSKLSKPTADSHLSDDELQDQSHAPSALSSFDCSKHPKFSDFIPDTDSEDDLAAGEQLLKEFEGEKTRATETADSLLRRFQKQPVEHADPPPSSPQPLPRKRPSKPKYLTSPSSKHHRPSMTAPFPAGKSIRRSIPPGAKGNHQTGATKAVVPLDESENDSSTKKRKRDIYVKRRPLIRPSSDPEAEWSPRR